MSNETFDYKDEILKILNDGNECADYWQLACDKAARVIERQAKALDYFLTKDTPFSWRYKREDAERKAIAELKRLDPTNPVLAKARGETNG